MDMNKPTVTPEQSRQDKVESHDLTGRDRLVSNVLFSWAAHSVFIVAGFITPRMINRRLGQDLLGVWDFSWSLVNYFQLVRASIGSSVNRYIAMHRATGDNSAVNEVASSSASRDSAPRFTYLHLPKRNMARQALTTETSWTYDRIGETSRKP